MVASWRRVRGRVISYLAFSPEVGREIHANAIESIHALLRRISRTRGHILSGDADTKLIGLALRNVTANRERAFTQCRAAANRLAIACGGRFTRPAAQQHGGGDMPAASAVRRKRRPRSRTAYEASHTECQTALPGTVSS